MYHGGAMEPNFNSVCQGTTELPNYISGAACSPALHRRSMRTPDEVRESIRAYMERRGLKPTPWGLESGLSENTVARILDGRTRTITDATIRKLAQQQGVDPGVITGDLPDPLHNEPSDQEESPEAQMTGQDQGTVLRALLEAMLIQQDQLNTIIRAMNLPVPDSARKAEESGMLRAALDRKPSSKMTKQ